MNSLSPTPQGGNPYVRKPSVTPSNSSRQQRQETPYQQSPKSDTSSNQSSLEQRRLGINSPQNPIQQLQEQPVTDREIGRQLRFMKGVIDQNEVRLHIQDHLASGSNLDERSEQKICLPDGMESARFGNYVAKFVRSEVSDTESSSSGSSTFQSGGMTENVSDLSREHKSQFDQYKRLLNGRKIDEHSLHFTESVRHFREFKNDGVENTSNRREELQLAAHAQLQWNEEAASQGASFLEDFQARHEVNESILGSVSQSNDIASLRYRYAETAVSVQSLCEKLEGMTLRNSSDSMKLNLKQRFSAIEALVKNRLTLYQLMQEAGKGMDEKDKTEYETNLKILRVVDELICYVDPSRVEDKVVELHADRAIDRALQQRTGSDYNPQGMTVSELKEGIRTGLKQDGRFNHLQDREFEQKVETFFEQQFFQLMKRDDGSSIHYLDYRLQLIQEIGHPQLKPEGFDEELKEYLELYQRKYARLETFLSSDGGRVASEWLFGKSDHNKTTLFEETLRHIMAPRGAVSRPNPLIRHSMDSSSASSVGSFEGLLQDDVQEGENVSGDLVFNLDRSDSNLIDTPKNTHSGVTGKLEIDFDQDGSDDEL